MLPLPPEKRQVSPFFVFYLITSAQIGMGILSLPRYIVKSAGQDAWIAIIITALSIHVILWMVYQILNKGTNDITVTHKELFGKWLGGLLSLALIVYLLLVAASTLRGYIEMIQVWIFPQLDTWYMALILSALVYVYVIGGFRVVVGICCLSFIFNFPLIVTLWFPLQDAQFSHLFPVFDHSAAEILSASKKMTLYFSGFETIFFFYPFIKNARSSQKWAQYGAAFTTFIYLAVTIISIMYFNKNQLIQTIWPTITLWKVVDFPFLERFEYLNLAIWLFNILPSTCLFIWAATRGIKQLFTVKQKHSLIVLLVIISVAAVLLKDREQIQQLNTMLSSVSFYVMYAYIPFVFFYQLIKSKVRKTL
ncbi:GerAB/ArcD/ProY family transporter [Bacillus aerolatus]|uniref:GerAB/ArcD/ProY family transporter n=1 Tax=Bacillus aerolatus TaxID=2653354 RepID=A0A6I1FFP0_9BACI|nr:GerAB/ArcD/ProY family transporter [Bacillus aerolatus]KAB7706984.1 GerAB/ArcD/ProY family transporter [Bacillus aerolatus]